jgi:hypothetical protein
LTTRDKHAIRTAVQVVVGIATAVPTYAEHLPTAAVVTQVVAVAALVTRYFPKIEALPFFPSWLKVK